MSNTYKKHHPINSDISSDTNKNQQMEEEIDFNAGMPDDEEMDLPIEEYIYNNPEEKEQAISRFRELINLTEENRTEEDAIELLFTAKKLFYNHHGLDAVEKSRAQMMAFWDIDVDDEHYPPALSGSADEDRTATIDKLLDDAYPLDELEHLNFNKLANKHPEIPLFKLLNIEQMALNNKKEKSILNKLDEYCSEHPNNLLFQILNDKFLARNEKAGNLITKELLENSSASKLFKRNWMHSVEFYLLHSAVFEYLITAQDLLLMDALLHCTNVLFPHLEDLYAEKEVYSEILKVRFCEDAIMN